MRQAALRSALSWKYREKKLLVLDQFSPEEGKTKKFLEVLKALEIPNALIITDEENPALERSARNVRQVQVLHWGGLNVYDILRYDYLVFLRSSLERVERNLRP